MDGKDKVYTVGPMKVFSMSERAPKGLAMGYGGLEEEKAASEHDCKQNRDGNGKRDHLRPRHYLAKLLSMLATAIGL